MGDMLLHADMMCFMKHTLSLQIASVITDADYSSE